METTDDEVITWLRSKNVELIPVGFKDTMTLGCNVVALGNDRVLSTAQSADLNEQLRARGFEVYAPNVSQFTLGGGGVHCMCQPLKRD
jgi:N-dimethylarginine dimethylaminohydrolase